jgi:hypothetical protein
MFIKQKRLRKVRKYKKVYIRREVKNLFAGICKSKLFTIESSYKAFYEAFKDIERKNH